MSTSLAKLTIEAGGKKYAIDLKEVIEAQPMPNRYYVLYYGDPLAGLDQIANTKPAFVILAKVYGKDITDKYHAKGCKPFAYIPTKYGDNNVDAQIKQAIDGGNDGIFFDEVNGFKTDYNKHISDLTRAANKTVIFNTGTPYNLPAQIFESADIVCVENYWFANLKNTYPSQPASKFMSVQGDPANDPDPRFQTPATLAEALSRLAMFRQNGGMWYYSGYQNTHWKLAPFLSEFGDKAR